jgi:chromosome segregation ATPase
MPNNGDFSKQQAVLDRLEDEMGQAKSLYESAKEAYERLRKELEDEGPERLESKFEQARNMKAFLQSLYQNSVKRYNGYLLDNLSPEPKVHKAGG